MCVTMAAEPVLTPMLSSNHGDISQPLTLPPLSDQELRVKEVGSPLQEDEQKLGNLRSAVPPSWLEISVARTHTHTHMYKYTHTHTERERERDMHRET